MVEAQVETLNLIELEFDPILKYGYRIPYELEPDLREAIQNITFKYQKGKLFPDKLLKGKTSRMVITSDTVSWYHSLFMGKPVINQMKKGVLEFCGVQPVKTTYLGPMKSSTVGQRKKWILLVNKLGEELK